MSTPVSTGAAIENLLAAQQSATQSSVAYKVAGKALDAQRASGDAAIQLLEAAVPGKAVDRGGQLDTVR
ncbi:MAG: hypothetical protein AAGJ46_19530 [Planctomycetota bacterium]